MGALLEKKHSLKNTYRKSLQRIYLSSDSVQHYLVVNEKENKFSTCILALRAVLPCGILKWNLQRIAGEVEMIVSGLKEDGLSEFEKKRVAAFRLAFGIIYGTEVS